MRLLGEVNVSEYLVTGNEYVSLPTIRQRDGAIESLSFLHMGAKGMIELCGSSDKPLIAPFAEINGLSLPEGGLRWKRLNSWVCLLYTSLHAPLKSCPQRHRFKVV